MRVEAKASKSGTLLQHKSAAAGCWRITIHLRTRGGARPQAAPGELLRKAVQNVSASEAHTGGLSPP